MACATVSPWFLCCNSKSWRLLGLSRPSTSQRKGQKSPSNSHRMTWGYEGKGRGGIGSEDLEQLGQRYCLFGDVERYRGEKLEDKRSVDTHMLVKIDGGKREVFIC